MLVTRLAYRRVYPSIAGGHSTRQVVIVVDWRHRAACINEDPELFFPNPATGFVGLQVEAAKQVCRRCDVTSPCLRAAIEQRHETGVWGGLSQEERRAVSRRIA